MSRSRAATFAVIAGIAAIAAIMFAGPAYAQGGAGSWNAGKLYVPAALAASGEACESAPAGRCAGFIKPDRHPVVLFLHGCGGLRDYRAFRDLGAIVISPDSFAGRLKCDFGNVLAMVALSAARAADLAYALAQIKAAAWADPGRLVLAGFSHGGMIAASHAGSEFKARVIIAWTCHIPGFPDLEGIKGTGPALVVWGSEDEFYKQRGIANRCAEFMKARAEPSQYVAIPGAGHNIVDHAATRVALKTFIPAVLK